MFIVVVTALLSLLCLSSGYLLQGMLFYTYAAADIVAAAQHDLYRDGVCAFAVAQACGDKRVASSNLWNNSQHGFITDEIVYELRGEKLTITVKLVKNGKPVRSCRLEGVVTLSLKKKQFTCVRIEDF